MLPGYSTLHRAPSLRGRILFLRIQRALHVTSSFSEHRYSGSFCQGSGGLLQDLMTKNTIRGNLSVFTPDIAETRKRGLDYVLGETNSYACHVR